MCLVDTHHAHTHPLASPQAKINSRGFGILDIKFVNDQLAYACGGSGSLFKTGAGLGVFVSEGSAGDLWRVIMH